MDAPAKGGASRVALRGAQLTLLAAVLTAVLTACAWRNPDQDPTRAHHLPDGFRNSDGSQINKPLSEVLAWQWRRWREDLPRPPAQSVQGYAGFPVLRPDLDWLGTNRSQPSVTFIGHATVLLQVGGLNILTDPVFSPRASPFSWLGPQRRVALPARLEELPRVDVVLISHNHYDHLDESTVRSLAHQPGGSPLFLVPLGVDRWLREEGVERVQALDWWSAHREQGVDFTLVPAHHWSTRSLVDRHRTLWGGWVARTPAFSAYYAGDTGYSKDFAEIGRRLGPFDLALIPVGAFEPRDFMFDQHINPTEAVKVHQEVGARLSIGVHWGTFELADDALDAPLQAIPAAMRAAGRPPEEFILLRHGETRRWP